MITLQILNDYQNAAGDSNLSGNATALTTLLHWKGVYGPVTSMISYGQTPRRQYKTLDGNQDDKVSISHAAIGAQIELGATLIDIDLVQQTIPEFKYYATGETGVTPTTEAETKSSAVILQVMHQVNKFKPFLKLRSDKSEVKDTNKWEEMGLTVGTFYMPDDSIPVSSCLCRH